MFGEDKRNLVIAIAAIFVILVGWQFLMPVLFPPEERPVRIAEAPAPDALPAERVTIEVVQGDEPEAPAQPLQAGIDSPRVAIDSPRIRGSISRLGGRIDSVTLRGYHETADEESPEIVLLSPRDAARPYFADFGWASAGDDTALPAPTPCGRPTAPSSTSGSRSPCVGTTAPDCPSRAASRWTTGSSSP